MQLGFAAQSAFAGRKDWHSLVDALPCRPRKRLSMKVADGNFLVEASSILFMKRKPLPNPSVQFFKIVPFLDYSFGKYIKIALISFQKSIQRAALLQLSIERNGPLYAFSLYRSYRS